MQDIYNNQNSEIIFSKLFNEASPEGKLYALCGLFHYNYNKYLLYVNCLQNNKTEVIVFEGCEILKTKYYKLIKKEGNNIVRLNSKDDTIKQWLERNNIKDGFDIDFTGSGYPALLIDYIHSPDGRIKDK